MRCNAAPSRGWQSPRAATAGVVLVLTGFAAAPPAALAASVDVREQLVFISDESGVQLADVVAFHAAPGEANRLTVTTPTVGEVRVREAGAALTAGAGCNEVAPGEALCRGRFERPFAGLRAELDDGDDTATLSGGADDQAGVGGREPEPAFFTFVARGGAGRDRLSASGVIDELFGGEGDDLLEGGNLHGEAGDDAMDGRGKGVASYEDATTPVRVDLADASPDGRRGERDRLRGIADIVGGRGDDVLIGDNGPNVLTGGGGRDLLRGGAGADELHGLAGVDRLEGGRGDDLLVPREPSQVLRGQLGAADRLSCGRGRDLVLSPAAKDELALDCERYSPGFGVTQFPAPPLRLGARTVRFSLPCPRGGEPCRTTLTLRSAGTPGRLLGRGRERLAPGRRRLAVPLTAAGRRLLPRVRLLRVTLRIASRFSTTSAAYTLRLGR